VQAGHAHIINPLHLVAHDVRGDRGFLSHGKVAGAGAQNRDLAGPLGELLSLHRGAPGRLVMNHVLEFPFQGARMIIGDPGHQDALFVRVNPAGDLDDLVRRLAGAENHLGKALAQRPLGIDLGKSKVGHGRRLEGVKHLLAGYLPEAEFLEQGDGFSGRHTMVIGHGARKGNSKTQPPQG